METSLGRVAFGMDDDYKPLRAPHRRAPTSSSPLSSSAQEFVPSHNRLTAGCSSGSQLNATPPHQVQQQPQLLPPSAVQNRIVRIQHPEQCTPALNCGNSYPTNMSAITSSVQNRLEVYNRPASDLNSNYLEPAEVETVALTYLANVIVCLNENPGSFDTIAIRFITIFEGLENNEYVLSNAMEDIFNESIENSNFRYMGAKLYFLLHMLNPKDDSLFHTLLKCKLDYHQTEVMEFMLSNSEKKVRETALFLAELYMQLQAYESHLKLIAENIVFSLKQLLTKVSADNIRCICLTLKLAGYDLDSICPNDVSIILQLLETQNKANPGKYPLVQNVISLKRTNWGRTVSHDHSSASRSPSESSCHASTEPTFYGPDGKVITDEESRFLADGNPSPSDDYNGFDSDVDLDPEMDEETEDAYRKFCKLNK